LADGDAATKAYLGFCIMDEIAECPAVSKGLTPAAMEFGATVLRYLLHPIHQLCLVASKLVDLVTQDEGPGESQHEFPLRRALASEVLCANVHLREVSGIQDRIGYQLAAVRPGNTSGDSHATGETLTILIPCDLSCFKNMLWFSKYWYLERGFLLNLPHEESESDSRSLMGYTPGRTSASRSVVFRPALISQEFHLNEGGQRPSEDVHSAAPSKGNVSSLQYAHHFVMTFICFASRSAFNSRLTTEAPRASPEGPELPSPSPPSCIWQRERA
jgi:hypothetical protein